MSCWISVCLGHDQSDAAFYGMLVGESWKETFREEGQTLNGRPIERKSWSLWLYQTEKGRQRGLTTQAARNRNVDIIFLELKLSDLIKNGRLVPVPPPRDRRVPKSELDQIRQKKK